MKNKKIWITASIICIILGVALTAAGRLMGGHAGFYIDNRGVHAAGAADLPEPIHGSMAIDEFDSMEIHADYADVELIPSDEFAVEYCLIGNWGEPVCEVQNGRLIFQDAKRSQSVQISFFTGTTGVAANEPRYFVKVKLPKETRLSKAVFDIECGDLTIPSLHADTLQADAECGDVSIDKYEGKALEISLESGDLSLGTVNAAQANLSNDYGRIEITEAAGESLTVQMDTCDLKAGSIDFSDTEISNDYGSVNIADATGGRLTARLESCDCKIGRLDFSDTEITDSYGDVILGLSGEIENYGFKLKTEYGFIRIGNQKTGDENTENEVVYTTVGDSPKKVAVTCEDGDIEIRPVK